MPAKLSVVVADDDQQTADVVAQMLTIGGFEPVVTNSAYEALGYLLDQKPSVVVSDVRMRGIDGLELLQRAMSMRDPDLDVILMSGWSMMSDEQALALGTFGQLDKPFDAEKLIAMVTAAARKLEDRWHANGVLPKADVRIDDRMVTPELQSGVSLGRTGLFIPLPTGDLPAPDQIVQLALTGTAIGPINGIGSVRWRRDTDTGLLPRGIGVEYSVLSDISRQSLVRYLRDQRVTACIPGHSSAA